MPRGGGSPNALRKERQSYDLNDTINDEAGVDVQTSTGTSGTVATDTVATNMNVNDNTSNVTAVSPTSLSADPPDGTTSTAPTNHKAPYWTETPPSVKAVRRRILGQRKTDIDAQRDENDTNTDTNAATTNTTTSMSTSSNRRTLSDVGLQSALSSTDSTLFHSTSTHANGQNEEALNQLEFALKLTKNNFQASESIMNKIVTIKESIENSRGF